MKRFLHNSSIVLTFFSAAVFFSGCAQHRMPGGSDGPLPPLVVAPGDKQIVVARVNGAPITRYFLIDMMNHMSAVSERASVSESRGELQKKALNRLIFEELAFQETKRRGMKLDEGTLERAMATVKANLGDEDAYKNFLANSGFSEEELRSQVERVRLLQLIMDQEVMKRVSVPDEEIRKEYDRQKARLITPEKVSVEDVTLFLDQRDPASLKKANGLLAQIKADKETDPANLPSDGTFVVQRIDLDQQKDPALYKAARKLEVGQLSEVIRTSDSLHILRLVGYTPEKQLTYEEVRRSLEMQLKTAAQVKRRQEWERELKKGAMIEILEPNIGRKD